MHFQRAHKNGRIRAKKARGEDEKQKQKKTVLQINKCIAVLREKKFCHFDVFDIFDVRNNHNIHMLAHSNNTPVAIAAACKRVHMYLYM